MTSRLLEKMNVFIIFGLLLFINTDNSITGEITDDHFIEKRALNLKVDCKGCVDLCLWKFHCEMCWKASCDQSGCTCEPVSGGCRLTSGCQNVGVRRQQTRKEPKRP